MHRWLIPIVVLLASTSCVVASAGAAVPGDTLLVSQGDNGLAGTSTTTGEDGNSDGTTLVSAGGTYVAFQSQANTIIDGVAPADLSYDWGYEVYVRDMATGTTVLASRATGSDGAPATEGELDGFSSDGRYVLFEGQLEANGPWAVYRRDLQTGVTQLVSVAPDGTPVGGWNGVLSANGRYVVFQDNTYGPANEDTNGNEQLYIRDLDAGTTVMISRASGQNGVVQNGTDLAATGISPGGRYVVFETSASNLVPGVNGGTGGGGPAYLYVRDVRYGTTILASRDNGSDGAAVPVNSSYATPVLAGGCEVVFAASGTETQSGEMTGTDIAPGSPADGSMEVYVRNPCTGSTALVSRASGADGVAADTASQYGSASAGGMSADGNEISFSAVASDLVPGTSATLSETYVRNLASDATTPVSVANGANGAIGSDNSGGGGASDLSPDGEFAGFISGADNLVDEDTYGWDQVYERDLGGTAAATPASACGPADDPAISPPAAPACPASSTKTTTTTPKPVVVKGTTPGTTTSTTAPPNRVLLLTPPRVGDLTVASWYVSARLSSAATLTVTVEARRKRHKRTWRAVASDHTSIPRAGVARVLLKRLKTGSYRLVIRATGEYGVHSHTITRSLRVR